MKTLTALFSASFFLSAHLLIASEQVTDSLKRIENRYLAAFRTEVERVHLAKVDELDRKYLEALTKAFQAATQGERLQEALAMRDEINRVKAPEPLPETDQGAEPALMRLRQPYREVLAKLMAARAQAARPIVKNFDKALAEHQAALTKAGKVDEAAAVLAYRQSGMVAKLLGEGSGAGKLASAGSPSGARADPVLAATTKVKPVENTLGMKFVPVKGTDVLFCIHETRYKDYSEYARANPGIDSSWQNQTLNGFQLRERAEDHPVVSVSCEDAMAFCKWLSQKEKKTYRLPTDREWSVAVGLGRKEKWSPGDTPSSVPRDQSDFPWGRQWPPPRGAGNFSDESRKAKAPDPSARYIDYYDDGYPTTAPVMSFKPNDFGLYDLSGNVYEWVEDCWNEAKTDRVLRGGSWNTWDRGFLSSSFRYPNAPDSRRDGRGFRVVVVVSDAP